MSEYGFNPTIHAPNRLQICAFLAQVKEIEFRTLKEHLGVSDSVLSKHLKTLEDSGYIYLDKRNLDGRARSWIGFTDSGKKAYEGHVAELRALLN